MAGFDIVKTQDAITARVKSIVPNCEVYEDSPPDDVDLPYDAHGKLKPYVVIRYGPIRPAYTGKNFGGPTLDEYWASCDIVAIADSGRAARLLSSALVGRLIGYKPDGLYPIQMRTDAGDPAQFVVSSNESRPTQYVSTTRLRYAVNAASPGSVIPIPTP